MPIVSRARGAPLEELGSDSNDDDDLDEVAAGALGTPTQHQRRVDFAHDRDRIDAFLAGADLGVSRAQGQRLLDDGHVAIGGVAITRAAHRVTVGDVVDISVPAPVALELVPENIPLVVLYEDADLIVIDKAAGMVVHPAPGHATGTLVHALLHHCQDLAGIGGTRRPGIVHRLDKDTSGVMVAAKHDAAHVALSAAFASKTTMIREYVALCSPAPRQDAFTIDTLHARHPVDRKRFSSKVATGKRAITHVEVIARFGGATSADAAAELRLRLGTGRTHQIRVHAADQGFALLADPVYGVRPRSAPVVAATAAIGRQALHAARLAFDHPITGVRLDLATPPPADYAGAREILRAW